MNPFRLSAFLGLVLALAGTAAAQTPFTTSEIAKAPPPATAKPGEAVPTARAVTSPANSWMGAQLGYKFGANSKDLGDNLLVSASAIYDIPLKDRKFHLPVISNFAHLVSSPTAETKEGESDDKLKELMLASSGIRAGLYPYREIAGLKKDDFEVVIHGEASWKLNGFKQEDSEDINYLNQLRLGGGVEFAIGDQRNGGKPLTVSITAVQTRFDRKEYEKAFKEAKSSLKALEVVAVLPIAARTGVLFEYVRGSVNTFRAGIILAAEK